MTISRTGRAPARNAAVRRNACFPPPAWSVIPKSPAVATRRKRSPSFFVQAHSAAASAGQDQRSRATRCRSRREEKQGEGRQDEEGQRKVGKLRRPHTDEKRCPHQDHRGKIPLAPAPQEAERGAQKAEGQEGKDECHDGGDGKAFPAHVAPAPGDGKREEQRIVPVAPVQAAGECIAPVIAAPEDEAGMHVPDEPGVPPAVGLLQKGQDEGGRRGDEFEGKNSRQEDRKTGSLPGLRERPGLPGGGLPESEETGDPGGERDAEIDDREVPVDPGQKAEERETGRDAEAEAGAGKKGEGPPGSGVFQGGAEEKRQQDAGGQGGSSDAMKRRVTVSPPADRGRGRRRNP